MPSTFSAKSGETDMIIVSSKPGGFFTLDGDAGDRDVSAAPCDNVPVYSIEDMSRDPEVCGRVGRIISRAVQPRGTQHRPLPRTRSGGSED